MCRLLVYGGRDFTDKTLLWQRLEEIDFLFCIDTIIEGEADGADRLARKWAKTRGCPWHPFPANWYPDGKTLDRGAGPKRNAQMLIEGVPDAALECPGGKGTRDMHDRLVKAGITPMKLMDVQPWLPLLKSLQRSGKESWPSPPPIPNLSDCA